MVEKVRGCEEKRREAEMDISILGIAGRDGEYAPGERSALAPYRQATKPTWRNNRFYLKFGIDISYIVVYKRFLAKSLL